MKTITFNPNATREQQTKDALRQLEPHRRGFKQVIFPFHAFDVTAMKDCPLCKKASPITWDSRFCCRTCMVLFP